MDISKLVWGIICLSLAALLAVLTFVLPEDKMMFMVGDESVPIVPVVALGVVGVILLAMAVAGNKGQRTTEVQVQQPQDPETLAKMDLNKRLETISWGLFLIMLGGFILVSPETISKGVWSIGVGLIMLGLNVARYFYHIKMSGFTTFLGIIAILSGVLQLFGMEALEGGTVLILLGAYLIARPWFDKRQIFGKAEEG